MARRSGFIIGLLAWATGCGAAEPTTQPLATLQDKQVNESSGLALGIANPNTFWTHNDSGDGPVLYAFDRKGRNRGRLQLLEAKARDWEDMASYKVGKNAFLLAADIGDNYGMWPHYTVYITQEPVLGDGARTYKRKPDIKLEFVYEDGPHNCESIAVDTAAGRILLLTKRVDGKPCKLYSLPLPARTPDRRQTAKALATLTVPTTTAMDLSPDGRRLVVLGYGTKATEWVRPNTMTDWAGVLAKPGRRLNVPARRQGEAICYGPDGKAVYLTSEKLPTPFFRVRLAPADTKP